MRLRPRPKSVTTDAPTNRRDGQHAYRTDEIEAAYAKVYPPNLPPEYHERIRDAQTAVEALKQAAKTSDDGMTDDDVRRREHPGEYKNE